MPENWNDCDSELMDRCAVKGRFTPVARIPAGSKLGWIHSDTLACAALKKHLVPLDASHPLTHSNFVSPSPIGYIVSANSITSHCESECFSQLVLRNDNCSFEILFYVFLWCISWLLIQIYWAVVDGICWQMNYTLEELREDIFMRIV